MGVSRSLWDYRDFIQRSRAEFGVAKHAYVANRSGWFSDRTECYLAAGRPALVQDTGWSSHLPTGTGLIGFSSPEEALDGLDADRARLRRARAARRRDRARALRRRTGAAAVPGDRVCADAPLRIALVAPVAQPVPPPRSGSIEAMTALLTDGLVAARLRRHAVRHRRLLDSCPAARRLRARLSRGSDALAVGAVRAVQPGGGGRARGSVRPHPLPGGVHAAVAGLRAACRRCRCCRRCTISPSPAEVALWSRYPRGAVRGGVARAGARRWPA